MGSRPAGYSSDEDSDFECFGFESDRPNKSRYIFQQEAPQSPDDKLTTAVINNNIEHAQAALDEGANIHCRSPTNNNTPIMQAAYSAHFDILTFLINHGANVNDNFEMLTVLMCLCNSFNSDNETLLQCLNLLLKHKADPLAKDWIGSTALTYSVRKNRELLAARLIECGCSVNETDGDGWTPLFHAVQNRNIEMTKFLIDAGGKISYMDRTGRMLVDIASIWDDKELINLVAPKDELDYYTQNSVDIKRRPFFSQYKELISTVNRDPISGFHEDGLRFIQGIGLKYVASTMEHKHIQFSQLMTWKDEDWKQAGVELSYHLNKIAYSVRVYHERDWGKGAFPNIGTVVVEGKVDLFNTVQILLTSLRVVHINAATAVYISKHIESPTPIELALEIPKTLNTLLIMKKQLQALRIICYNIEENSQTQPPDLILSNDYHLQHKSKYKRVVCGFLAVVIVIKCQYLKSAILSVCRSIVK